MLKWNVLQNQNITALLLVGDRIYRFLSIYLALSMIRPMYVLPLEFGTWKCELCNEPTLIAQLGRQLVELCSAHTPFDRYL